VLLDGIRRVGNEKEWNDPNGREKYLKKRGDVIRDNR
jgi:hypothetical protein